MIVTVYLIWRVHNCFLWLVGVLCEWGYGQKFINWLCWWFKANGQQLFQAKGGHGKRGKSKGKTSATKLSNKHLTKLGRQGKLNQEAQKKKLKEKKREKARLKAKEREKSFTALNPQNGDDVIEEEDVGFYGNKDLKSSFLSTFKTR